MSVCFYYHIFASFIIILVHIIISYALCFTALMCCVIVGHWRRMIDHPSVRFS